MQHAFLIGRAPFSFSSNVKLTWDGNSLVAGVGAETTNLPQAVQLLHPVAGSGSTYVNYGIAGQTWRQMSGLDGFSAADVDGSFESGKQNILILWETTNSIYNTSRTGMEAIGDAVEYITARKAAHPEWRIVLLSTIPRYGSTYNNEQLMIADSYMRSNWASMGVEAFVDIRREIPQLDFDGSSEFTGFSSGLWAEMVHLNDNGYAAVAAAVVRTLRRLPRRSS